MGLMVKKDTPSRSTIASATRRRSATVLTGDGFSTRRSAASSVRSVSPSAIADSALRAAPSTRPAASLTNTAAASACSAAVPRRARRCGRAQHDAFRRVHVDDDVGD